MTMKRLMCIAAALLLCVSSAMADEGMWMLPLLKSMNSKDLKKAGCKLSPDQIYNLTRPSLKDAIVQFGGGCTGEIISDEGLLVTNHHCGYGSIQKLSSVEHDYLKDGYWAMNRSEELPVEGLTVTFIESMTDITAAYKAAYDNAKKESAGREKADSLFQAGIDAWYARTISAAEEANPHCDVDIVPFYDRNVFYLIVSKEYKDIRFVGAPPSSIGKFGADTDNWMWPRHTGDFSMFRVYAGADNEPATYAETNVPLKPKKHLKISLKGYKEGDFTMIMGFPGRTTRFQASPMLENQIITNDIRIAARTVRQNIMMEEMQADPAVKIQYASKYASSSNGWKRWQGMKLAFKKLGIIERAKQEEAEFMAWLAEDAERQEKYGNALSDIAAAVAAGRPTNLALTTLSESVYRIELVTFAMNFRKTYLSAIKNGIDTTEALLAAKSAVEPLYKDYSEKLDRKVTPAMLTFYKENAADKYALSGIGDDIEDYCNKLFAGSAFTAPANIDTAIASGPAFLDSDTAIQLGQSINRTIRNILLDADIAEKDGVSQKEAVTLYTGGLLEWKAGQPSYPDANFTMRLTYGHVMGYSPADGIEYDYYTTLDGVMEKEDPDNWEFVVPAKLKELWRNKDFGQYGLKNGKMPVAFLSNNDITGGNSGSPIMNAKGELLGLAFDGNWESSSSDIMFEPELQRCINVDIRYVLFIMDKFGGAGWLLDEMDLVK